MYLYIYHTHSFNASVYLKLKVTVWLIYATLFILNKEIDYFTLTLVDSSKI